MDCTNREKLLIVVDMQNDFVTGSLANEECQKIVPLIENFLKNWDGEVVFTKDTHEDNYLETQEGMNLPVKHCIVDTPGHDIIDELCPYCYNVFEKDTFASESLSKYIDKHNEYKEVYLCGVCTDICVVSNALMIKSICPDVKLYCLSELCAGTTLEKHEAALKVMESCQIYIS